METKKKGELTDCKAECKSTHENSKRDTNTLLNKLDSHYISGNLALNTGERISENRIAERLLTVEELAFKLGVSRKTIYGWIYRGIIKPIKVGPRLVRFEPKEVERWISNQGDS